MRLASKDIVSALFPAATGILVAATNVLLAATIRHALMARPGQRIAVACEVIYPDRAAKR